MAVRLALLCLLVIGASALFEDQRGTFDWYQQHVGTVSRAFFHKSKPRIFISSEQNVVASLHLRDGAIIWRRVLEEDDSLDDLAYVAGQGCVVSLSGQGKNLRAWDQQDGALLWDTATYSGTADGIASSHILLLDSKDPTLAVAPAGALQLFDLSDGRALWGETVPLPPGANIRLLHDAASSQLLAFTYDIGDTAIGLLTVSEATGEEQGRTAMSGDKALGGQAASSGGTLAILSEDLTTLCTASRSGLQCTPLEVLAPQLAGSTSLQLLATGSGFTLASTDPTTPGVALLSEGDGQAQLLRFYPEAALASGAVRVQQAEAAALVRLDSAAGQVLVEVVNTATGEQLHAEAAPAPPSLAAAKGAPAAPAAAYLGTYRRKEGKEGLRVLVRWSDAGLVLLQQGQAVWERPHEALASTRQALFSELPADPAVAAAVAPSLSDQMQLQILGLKAQWSLHTQEEADELARLRTRLSSRSRPTRDANGLRRLVLLLTGAGKVVALHTGGGPPLWSHRWAPGQAPDRLLLWRTFHDTSHAPQVLALRTGASPHATLLDVHSGEEVPLPADQALPANIEKLVHIEQPLHDGTAEQHIYVALPAAPAPPTLLPDTPAARAHLAARPALNYWRHDPTANSVEGYALPPPPAAGPLAARQVWRLQLPQPILALAARNPSEPVHSLSKVLGDRSFLIKYLNPNTLFLATGPAPGPTPTPSADPAARLTVHVLDTATGRVLHSQSHPGARGPVHATFSENWVVYQFFNAASGRLEMAVMELYDDTRRSFTAVDLVAGRVTNISQPSAAPPPLRVLSQAYYSRTPLRALAVTATTRGITSKQVVLATASDQVYAMEKRFLDPRRPMTQRPSREDQEEGLVPYMDTLPIFPTQYASFDYQVAGLRGVATAPAALESTSHMLAWGVDLLYTRLQPSGGFDTLPDDFSYGLLVLALGGLAVGAVALAFMSRRADLAAKWR